MTEAIAETLGKSVEPATNRLIAEMMPHLPDDAADMCAYLLEFASHKEPIPDYRWLGDLNAIAH